MRILVVEDDRDLNRLLISILSKTGYSVDACFDGEDALTYALGTDFDLIVMDVMMPKMDGFTVVDNMRSRGILSPVLFLSAKSSVEDRVKGLEVGGDYYLTKPFQAQELLAVIRAMLRKHSDNKTNVITCCDLIVNVSEKTVTRAQNKINLTSKEFSLLEYMIRNKGIVLSREMIEQHLWNYDYEGGTNVIDVYVGYLRKKIDTNYEKKLIHTVWGIGWKFGEQ